MTIKSLSGDHGSSNGRRTESEMLMMILTEKKLDLSSLYCGWWELCWDQTQDIIESFQVLTEMLAGCSQVLSQPNFTPEVLYEL